MKISVDDQELFTLTDTQKLVLQNNIQSDIFEDDIKRRLQWVIMHKYELCQEELVSQWKKTLAERYESIPTDADALAQLIFSQEEYKDRSSRDLESVAQLQDSTRQ